MNRARLLLGRVAAAAARWMVHRLRRTHPRITVITTEAPQPWPELEAPWPAGEASTPRQTKVVAQNDPPEFVIKPSKENDNATK